MFLGACGTNRVPLAVTPPVALMQACQETQTAVDRGEAQLAAGQPVDPPVTNGDLVRKVRALRVDLKNCNADKAALRTWGAAMR